MMDWNWSYGNNMMGGYGSGLMYIFWIILFVDSILLGIWLFKQINKK